MESRFKTLAEAGFTRLVLSAFALVFGVALFSMPSALYAQSAMPGMNGQKFEQVALSKDTAMSAMRAYKELKVRFKDQVPPGSDAKAFAMAMAASSAIRAILSDHGFDDTAIWHRTLLSLLLASNIGAGKNLDKMRRSLQQMRDNPNIPDATKDQLIAQMSAFIPSDENIEVAEAVAADPEGAALIAFMKE